MSDRVKIIGIREENKPHKGIMEKGITRGVVSLEKTRIESMRFNQGYGGDGATHSY